MDLIKRDYKILFVSSSGKIFKLIPFIHSQHESLKPYVKTIDHFRINGGGLKNYFNAWKDLKMVLKKNDYDIIHSHWTYSGILCSLLTRHEKLVISFMGNDLQGICGEKTGMLTTKGIINILLSQYLLFKVDAVIVKSKKMFRWIPPYFRSKTYIIPNGINLNRFRIIDQIEAKEFLNLDLQKKYILFLGDTKDSNKNFSLLKKALGTLDKLNIQYELIAPFPIDPSLIPQYLAAANVLAFPSKLEGSPNVVKEALAMGCPIVATDVGDVAERFGNIEGCYVSTFDQIDFAKKLKSALEFNKRINSIESLSEISESEIASKIIHLYEGVLTNRKAE